MKRLPIYRNRPEVPDDCWNFFWLCRYGFGFRLWLIELQVYWYKPGKLDAEVPSPDPPTGTRLQEIRRLQAIVGDYEDDHAQGTGDLAAGCSCDLCKAARRALAETGGASPFTPQSSTEQGGGDG